MVQLTSKKRDLHNLMIKKNTNYLNTKKYHKI